MTDRRKTSLFLERQAYRYRRLTDAARLLPVAGAVLLVLPMLWPKGTGTYDALVYLFVTWLVLILAVAALGRRLYRASPPPDEPEG